MRMTSTEKNHERMSKKWSRHESTALGLVVTRAVACRKRRSGTRRIQESDGPGDALPEGQESPPVEGVVEQLLDEPERVNPIATSRDECGP